MRIRFNVRHYIDRRTPALYEQHDAVIEKRWRDRVAKNPKEKARLERERILGTQKVLDLPVVHPVSILRRQAK
jgi:hypothetical protein